MKSRRRTSRSRNFSKIWVFYGLLAAILGIVQGFSKPLKDETKDEENKRRHTWRIIWGCYLILLFIILVAQLVVMK